jgi:hypothetical protein
VLALPLIPLIGVAAAFNTVFLIASILTALATYASSTTPAPRKSSSILSSMRGVSRKLNAATSGCSTARP